MKTLVLIVTALVGLVWLLHYQSDPIRRAGQDDGVTLYSLTGCSSCKQKARELDKAGIGYTVVYLDREPASLEALQVRMAATGHGHRPLAVPILDVRGVLLFGNAPMATVREVLKEKVSYRNSGET